IQTRATVKSILLESITFVIHGAHPTIPDEGLYLGMGKYQPKSQVAFAEIDDFDITRTRFDGFEPIMERLMIGLMEIIIGEIDSIE
ncbi:MAG: hypothetical protein WBA74_01980, partial [Cyclobacteriaceae bacterium]